MSLGGFTRVEDRFSSIRLFDLTPEIERSGVWIAGLWTSSIVSDLISD